MSHAIIEHQHCNDGLGQRKDHSEKEPEMAASVNAGRFIQFIGNVLPYIAGGNDDIKHIDGRKQDHYPGGIV